MTRTEADRAAWVDRQIAKEDLDRRAQEISATLEGYPSAEAADLGRTWDCEYARKRDDLDYSLSKSAPLFFGRRRWRERRDRLFSQLRDEYEQIHAAIGSCRADRRDRHHSQRVQHEGDLRRATGEQMASSLPSSSWSAAPSAASRSSAGPSDAARARGEDGTFSDPGVWVEVDCPRAGSSTALWCCHAPVVPARGQLRAARGRPRRAALDPGHRAPVRHVRQADARARVRGGEVTDA